MNYPLRSISAAILLLLALPVCVQSAEPPTYPHYTEPLRPRYHFSPETNWMNDPNGLVFFVGEYHLFYQYNPSGIDWGHMSWGHAVSTDLVHWKHLPIALTERGPVMAFSGSAVVDWRNTSGFGSGSQPPLVAIYTGHESLPVKHESQYIAYSNDRGRTWTPYSGNPVLDLSLPGFRDPKVRWFEPGGYWVMTVALADQHQIGFFRSADLKHWTLLSRFGPLGSTEGVWECPDLFPLPDPDHAGKSAWVLTINVGKGSPNGGSGGQYFVGDFDGTRFSPRGAGPWPTGWLDHGSDFYASVTYSDIPSSDGRRLMMGWMSNSSYGNKTPTSPWRHVQSLVRELSLSSAGGTLTLRQAPIREYQSVRGASVAVASQLLHDSAFDLSTSGIQGAAWEIEASIDPQSSQETGLSVFRGHGFETRIGYDHSKHTLFIDRSHSGRFHQGLFAKRLDTAYSPDQPQIDLHIFIDHSTVEVFTADGTISLSDLVFPEPGSDHLALFATGSDAQLISLHAWPMKSIWPDSTSDRP